MAPKKGSTPWNKGVKMSDDFKRAVSIGRKGVKGKTGKWERTDSYRELKSRLTKEQGIGGWNRGLKQGPHSVQSNAKRSEGLKLAYDEGRRQGNWVTNGGNAQWFTHLKPDGTPVRVQGTYELRMARVMDALGWIWNRFDRSQAVQYEWDGRVRHYGPDFTVRDGEFYIETKGWWTDLSEAKAQAFRDSGRTLLIVDRLVLEAFEEVA